MSSPWEKGRSGYQNLLQNSIIKNSKGIDMNQNQDNSLNSPFPLTLGNVISIVINYYRGYNKLEIHLFKPQWDESLEEAINWDEILGAPVRDNNFANSARSCKVLLETFTSYEKDAVLEYLNSKYQSHLNSISTQLLTKPIPKDLIPLCEIPESENIGIIRFEKIPNYTLDFPVHGLYDLSKYK